MTPQELAKLQRDFLIRAEKQSAILLSAEFEQLKREITEYLLANLSGKTVAGKLYKSDFLDDFIDLLTRKIDVLSSPSARIVAGAQKKVIRLAARSLKKYLNVGFESTIFSPDREAIRFLIGRAFEGVSLQAVFQRMKKPMANTRARQSWSKASRSANQTPRLQSGFPT